MHLDNLNFRVEAYKSEISDLISTITGGEAEIQVCRSYSNFSAVGYITAQADRSVTPKHRPSV